MIKYLSIFGDVSIEGPKWCGKPGHYEAVIQNKETNIYIIPITSLKP